MPYMYISGSFNTDTKVGGRTADPQFMAELGAKKGMVSQLYTTPFTAQEVLNMLEIRGWKVISTAAFPNGELSFTLHKDAPMVVLSAQSTQPSAPPSYAEKFGAN